MSTSPIVTATLLRRAGHHVDLAPNGPAAIEALRTTPYDLVLIDVFMPGLNGRETIEAMRALPEPVRSLPVVALTTNAAIPDEAAIKAAGMDGLLAKPVSRVELLEVLRRHVWTRSTAPDTNAVVCTDPPRFVSPVLSSGRINELRAAIPAATLLSAVEDCLVDMDRRLPALRRSLAARAPGAVSAHAQAITGMAAAYGMVALESRLRAIATAALEGDLSSLGTTIAADLDRDFEQAALSLRAILRTEMV